MLSLTTLESLRQTHEDLEILKHLATKTLQSRATPLEPHPRLHPLSFTSSLQAEQLTHDLVQSAHGKAQELYEAYENNPPRNEHSADPVADFYAALRDMRDVHRATSSGALVPNAKEKDHALIQAARDDGDWTWSGEEGGGRYLDLQSFYHSFKNLTHDQFEYYAYVRDHVTDFDRVKAGVRNGRAYAQYLAGLKDYLVSFAKKAYPMDGVDAHVRKAVHDVRADITQSLRELVDKYGNSEQLLRGLGADTVKTRLIALGLKCGGRPEDRAKRLYEAARKQAYGERVVLERMVKFVIEDLLCDERNATVANVEKKLSLSYAEIEAERDAEEAELHLNGMLDDGDDEEVEKTIYNPKDVPLGWDGKPIPYWMYKLHGLNHEFKCEICGNATYKGPRAFERHFTEAQHVNGLRRLGIGYSKAFLMITGISDALKLHDRIQRRGREGVFDEEMEMEFEDREGNVLNRRTFEDLQQRGLI